VFTIFVPRFFSFINILNILQQLSVTLLISAGITCIILTGEIDLSVGSVLALSACTFAWLINKAGVFPALMFTLCIGPIFGIIHGILVTKAGIPSFIVTIGTQMMARSLAFVITGGRVITDFPESFRNIIGGTMLGIPNAVLIVFVMYILISLLLNSTPFGKKVYATGENWRRASYAGINVDGVVITVFIISGLLVSLSSIVFFSRHGAIQPYIAEGLEFECIAAVVIGGTSLSGGKGNVLHTLIGVFIIGMLRNALNLAQVDHFWQNMAIGSIIILFSFLDAQNIFFRFPTRRGSHTHHAISASGKV